MTNKSYAEALSHRLQSPIEEIINSRDLLKHFVLHDSFNGFREFKNNLSNYAYDIIDIIDCDYEQLSQHKLFSAFQSRPLYIGNNLEKATTHQISYVDYIILLIIGKKILNKSSKNTDLEFLSGVEYTFNFLLKLSTDIEKTETIITNILNINSETPFRLKMIVAYLSRFPFAFIY